MKVIHEVAAAVQAAIGIDENRYYEICDEMDSYLAPLSAVDNVLFWRIVDEIRIYCKAHNLKEEDYDIVEVFNNFKF